MSCNVWELRGEGNEWREGEGSEAREDRFAIVEHAPLPACLIDQNEYSNRACGGECKDARGEWCDEAWEKGDVSLPPPHYAPIAIV